MAFEADIGCSLESEREMTGRFSSPCVRLITLQHDTALYD